MFTISLSVVSHPPTLLPALLWQMASRLEDIHTRHGHTEEQARERHRRQVTELNQRPALEMQEQLGRYHDDTQHQEDKWRRQAQEYEDR